MSSTTNGFPRALLSLSDDELSAVMSAAGGLQQTDRPAFLELLAASVAKLPEVGPGSLHRCVRDLLRQFSGRSIERRVPPIGKYGRLDISSRRSRGRPRRASPC